MIATLTAPPRPADPPLPVLLPAVRRREHLNRPGRTAAIALSGTLTAVVEMDGWSLPGRLVAHGRPPG